MAPDQAANCGAIQSQPHGLPKSLSEIHNDILFDRAVTAQLYCPKKVNLAVYPFPALAAIDHTGALLDIDPHPYRRLPAKKDIAGYAKAVAEKFPTVQFDIVTRDSLGCFQNGRARIGGMSAEPTGEFSSVLVFRHRPDSIGCTLR